MRSGDPRAVRAAAWGCTPFRTHAVTYALVCVTYACPSTLLSDGKYVNDFLLSNEGNNETDFVADTSFISRRSECRFALCYAYFCVAFFYMLSVSFL